MSETIMQPPADRPPGIGADSTPSIVGIGASAGGIEAFRSFFTNMPVDSGMAFVVVLHLPANRPSMLPDILGRWTSMPVRTVHDGALVEPNTVYVPPPHATTVLREGRLYVSQPQPGSPREFRPIDNFFDTLANTQRERSIGIILSGTGSDGALGLKAIRACGGLTIAQGSGEADGNGKGPQYPEMPEAAVATGTVDLVAPATEMPGHLIRLRAARLDAAATAGVQEDTEALRQQICAIMRAQIGHDFSGYKDKTFLRRVNRRMLVLNLGSMADYVARLRDDHSETQLLFRDLLIRVTSFFRDEATFDIIQRVVVPRIFQGRQADSSVRVWVPGCATGEEAYSLAILLREHMDGLRGTPRVQIFATDIDEPAIDTARLGRYPTVLLDGLSPERRQRFFTRSDSGYVVAKEIRDLCTFSPHSLVRDPPFSRMDLISCRNLLIYLDGDAQGAIIPAFHYALADKGILILGASESTTRHESLFSIIDPSARIFERRDVPSPRLRISRQDRAFVEKPARMLQPHEAETAMDGDRQDEPTEQLQRVASWFDRVGASIRDVARAAIILPSPGADRYPETGPVATVESLRRELVKTRQGLQSITEEHETSLEELRSANEELHSVNEELQSTNEELETNKEELQSVNEELHTVNSQLSDNLAELDRTNGDLKNLFDSTQIATVFLDRHMVVRSFTPAISGIYNLIPSDVGRPLTDIAGRLAYDTLAHDVETVLQTLRALERQVTDIAGNRHFIVRVLPYRAPDNTVTGTLVTFLDVTSIVLAERHQRLLVDELNHRVKNMLAVVISLAAQTVRHSAGLDDFSAAFMGRVRALSASYSLLSRQNWTSIALRETIEEELRPFASSIEHEVRLDGLDVQLTPAAALAFGMVIHELATNAVKYGALSQPGGIVDVSWREQDLDDTRSLVVTWREAGGPPVVTPNHDGFGTTLIRRSISDQLSGRAALEFQPDGLLAVLSAPFANLTSDGKPGKAGDDG